MALIKIWRQGPGSAIILVFDQDLQNGFQVPSGFPQQSYLCVCTQIGYITIYADYAHYAHYALTLRAAVKPIQGKTP